MTLDTNYAVAPGEYLAEWLDDTATTQQDAANLLGCSRKLVNEIVNGRAPVSSDTALKLERLTSIPADSWLRFETQYRLDLARVRENADLAKHASMIPKGTATYLRSIGATAATLKTPGQLVTDFLTFHRCGTWESFEASITDAAQGEYALAALTESKAAFDRVTCATWLRAGELSEAYERGRKYEFDSEQLRAALPILRERAATPDARLLRDFASILSDVGVVFSMVEPPDGLPLYGMTRWIDQKVPVIQQSGRRARDGFIIWTFFHELGHVLNDPRGETHIEYKNEKVRNSTAERNANSFAFDILFGDDGLKPFSGLASDTAIVRTARQIGVSPGVAVHQMHRKRLLSYAHGNRLMIELEW
ncbi:HigA family addiction module antitoxin [Plantibacter sp. T3]|uniref:HigA family addiction module antitoxin n=1 Tax=Plantibacter sp. T3 TaxID=2653161 RepID=UPI0012F2247C|nr:HigA family addiction module antitoxin [Plantibacter sp. T3]VXB11340.1 Addiction module antidote protein, HigA family [Plantibacter sp. T3]